MTIMITDDDCDDREILSQAIERIDPEIDIIQARDGEEALQILLHSFTRPDLMLMDINMPLRDGISTVEEIRNSHSLKDIPIVMYSTSFHPLHMERSREAGANSFLTKPDNFEALVKSLDPIIVKIKRCSVHG